MTSTRTNSKAKQIRPTVILSFLVWLLGASFAVAETLRLTGGFCTVKAFGEFRGLVQVVLIGVCFFTLIHQMLIFYSIHELEERDSDYSNLYHDWVGSNTEFILRLAAIGTILCVGGEIPNVIYFNLWRQPPPIPSWIYPVSSLGLFGILFMWDCLALRLSVEKCSLKAFFLQPLKGERAFFWSDLLGLIYFVVIAIATYFDHLSPGGFAVLVTTFILYAIVIIVRTFRYASKRKEREQFVAAATVEPSK